MFTEIGSAEATTFLFSPSEIDATFYYNTDLENLKTYVG